VMSVDGKIIFEKEIQATYYSQETYESIDVSAFSSGMYFVSLSTSTQTFFTQKLTVNH
jgi:Secretion system C-terminal sorting domain